MGDIAIYARVSVEHGNKKDDTVKNQVLAAGQFIRAHDELKGMRVHVYRDMGYTGQNFERPGWKSLMGDIRGRLISVLAVKDFSRIGRNYIETGELIEKILPQMGVRLISVSDGYDSSVCNICDMDMFSIGIKNIINDWYAKENGRKASLAKQGRRADGEYTGGVAPYGYRVEIDGGRRVLVPDESMEIINKIKRNRRGGMSSEMIVDQLEAERINKPSVYRKTGKLRADIGEAYCRWDSSGVRRLWGSRQTHE